MLMPRPGDQISADYATLLLDRYEAEVFRNAGLDQVNDRDASGAILFQGRVVDPR
jgi:hypothetical protein